MIADTDPTSTLYFQLETARNDRQAAERYERVKESHDRVVTMVNDEALYGDPRLATAWLAHADPVIVLSILEHAFPEPEPTPLPLPHSQAWVNQASGIQGRYDYHEHAQMLEGEREWALRSAEYEYTDSQRLDELETAEDYNRFEENQIALDAEWDYQDTEGDAHEGAGQV